MRGEGAWSILRFNWPWFAVAGAATVLAVVVTLVGHASLGSRALVLGPLVGADAWLVVALAISWGIYDRRGLAQGAWLQQAHGERVLVVHTGHDLASAIVRQRWAPAACRTVDVGPCIADPSASLRRARATAAASGDAVTTPVLPLAEGEADLVLAVFALHELRQPTLRVALCREMRRVLAPAGRMVVVEHLRDGWNVLAYGPGSLHFLSRRTWMATFAAAGLQLEAETTLTPWVHRFELARTSP